MDERYGEALNYLTTYALAINDSNFTSAVILMWKLYNEKQKVKVVESYEDNEERYSPWARGFD